MHSSDLVPFNGTMLCQVKRIEEFYSPDIPKSKGNSEINLQIRAKIQEHGAQPLIDKRGEKCCSHKRLPQQAKRKAALALST